MPLFTTISNDIKSHLLAIIVVVLLIGGSIYAVDGLVAKHDAATSAKYELLLSQAQAQTKVDEASFQQTLAQLSAQNASLSQSIAQRDAALATLLKQDAQLNSQQAGTKLGGTVLPSGDIDLPLNTARTVAAELDELPVVTKNLADETQVAMNLQTELTSQTKVVADLNGQLVAQTNSCNATIKSLKAKQRKRDIKIFIAGVVTGIVGGHWLGL